MTVEDKIRDAMGEVELNNLKKQITIRSNIITYGNASDPTLTMQIGDEIETMWNEPSADVLIHGSYFAVRFQINAENKKNISELEVISNLDPRNNYFRIEAFALGSISFVDGIGCNSGYFLLENLYKGSTTAAHEYGHTLGLDHPRNTDFRERGVPGIMYPRGTLVQADFQYEPTKPAGTKGGTMHPMFRKVKKEDIEALGLTALPYKNNRAIIGSFTNVYHYNHAESGDGLIDPLIS